MGRNSHKSGRMFGLKQQIFYFLAVFIVVILLLLGVFLAVMIGVYQRKQNQRRLDNLEVYGETLEESIGQLYDVVGSIYSVSNAFQGISSYQTEAEKCGYIQELMSVLQVQVRSNRYLSALIANYDYGKGVLYYTDGTLNYSDTKMLWNTGKTIMEGSRGSSLEDAVFSYTNLVQEAETDLFYSVIMKKKSTLISGSVRLSQGLPEEVETGAVYGIVYEGEFYRTGGQEAGLTREECLALLQGRNRVGDNFVYLHRLDAEDMAVLEILPRSLWLYVHPWHILMMVLMFFLTIWLLLLYRFIYDQLSEPLEDMTRTLRDIRQGDWEVNFTAPNRIVEIESVRQTIQMMLKELGQYKIKTYEEQLSRQKTQLQFLQLQLAPHFYTNCLKNIYYMLMMKEYESAEQFLLRMSKHLRYLLQKDTTLVTVETEREFVENYIGMQKLLSSRPILCSMAVEQAAQEEEIPILAIQTFVENSVKYTEVDKERTLEIQVQVKMIRTESRTFLNLTVQDNGPGYPDVLLDLLNRKDEEFTAKEFGVGILNLLNRLRIHYGAAADWHFDNREGAFSELILPVQFQDAEILT